MHVNDVILNVLQPGSPFNPKSKIFRSVDTVAAFAGLSRGDTLSLLAGDLAPQVVMKPSKKPGVILVALKVVLDQQAPQPEPKMVKVVGGCAYQVKAAEPVVIAKPAAYGAFGDHVVPGIEEAAVEMAQPAKKINPIFEDADDEVDDFLDDDDEDDVL